MARIRIPLGESSYESTSLPFSAQRCINMYAAVAREKSLSDVALFATPGVKAFATNGIKNSRGASVMKGVYYYVTGTTLYSISSAGVVTTIGTITGSKRVVMANNGEKLCIVVPGGNGYVYNATTTTLTQITDVDYRTADTVCFKDGYYIFTATAGDVFFISALNDPLTFDALDFGAAELFPDNIIGCHVNYDEVFILGEETVEVFKNVGGSGFPFQRVPGASYEKGSHSKYSPIEWEGGFYFLGGGINEKTAVYAAGSSAEPQRVSTDAIEQEIQKFSRTEIGEAFSFTYSVNGFSFVGFTIRSINIDSKTFVYNVTASELLGKPVWLEQQTGITDNAWRVNSVNFVYDKFLVSDFNDGRVGELDTETYTEYGDVILSTKTLPPFASDGKSMFVSSMELTIDSGQGLISGQGSDPKIMMDFSNDGGRTWKGEFWRPMGKIGEYLKRAAWRRLGRIPSHRVFRFKCSEPIKRVFMKLEAEVTSGN
jgi:hypothetical protein